MSTLVTTRVDRPLGYLEKYQTSKQLTGAYGNVAMSVTLEHEPIQGETAESFYMRHFVPVLTQLVDTHPALSMVVRDKLENSVHFEQLSIIDFARIVDITTKTVLQDLIKEAVDEEFDLDGFLPLWRLKVVSESSSTCTMVLVMHHTIGDGMSLSIFYQAFLKGLNSKTKDNQSTVMHQVTEAKCALPYELSNAPEVSLVWDVVPTILKSLVPKVLPTSIARWIHPVSIDGWKGDHPAIEGEKHNTEVRLIHVPLDIWKPIMVESKKRGISAHAIAFVAMLMAWQRLYPKHSTEVATPINCRGLCNPPVSSNQIGNYVGAYTSFWTENQLLKDKIWQEAKKYYQGLQKNKTHAGKEALYLKFLPQYPASYYDFWNDKRRASSFGRTGGLELSDLGKFTIGEEQQFKVKQMYFCQSAQIFTNALGMNTICVNDSLYCTIEWQKGSLEEDKVNMYHDIFIDILKNVPL